MFHKLFLYILLFIKYTITNPNKKNATWQNHHSFQFFVSEPLVQVVIRGKRDAESHMCTRSFEFTHNSLEFDLDRSSEYYSKMCYFL